MARKKSEAEVLEDLKQAKEKATVRYETAQKKFSENQRKIDTRKKIIYGSLLINMMEKGQIKKEVVDQLLDKFLTKTHDRKLMGLPTATSAISDGLGNKK